jgi:nucleoid DNA-binding protein
MKLTPEKLDQLRLLQQTRLNGYKGKADSRVTQPKLPVVSTRLLAESIAANELEGYYNKDEVGDVLAALAVAIPRLMLQGREVHINNLGKYKFKQSRGTVVTHANTGAIRSTVANFTPEFKFVDELKREIAYKFKHALQLAGKIETDQYMLARLKTAVELQKSGLDGKFTEEDTEIVVQQEETLQEIHSYSRKIRISKMLVRLKAERDKAREDKAVVTEQQSVDGVEPVVD